MRSHCLSSSIPWRQPCYTVPVINWSISIWRLVHCFAPLLLKAVPRLDCSDNKKPPPNFSLNIFIFGLCLFVFFLYHHYLSAELLPLGFYHLIQYRLFISPLILGEHFCISSSLNYSFLNISDQNCTQYSW